MGDAFAPSIWDLLFWNVSGQGLKVEYDRQESSCFLKKLVGSPIHEHVLKLTGASRAAESDYKDLVAHVRGF